MPALTLVCIFAGAFYLFLGMTALGRDPRARLNQVFAAAAAAFGLWAILFGLLYMAPDEDWVLFWDRAASPFWTATSGLVLHFVILLTRPGRPVQAWVYPLVYLPPVVAVIWEATGRQWFHVDFHPGPWGWVHDVTASRDWFACFLGGYLAQLSAAAVLVVRWRRRARLNRERHQAALLLATGVVAILGGLVTDVAMPLATDIRMPVLAPALALVWFGGVAISMARHRLLSPVPGVRPEQIVDGTTDLIVVVGPGGRVLEVNRRVQDLLGRSADSVLGRPARDLAVDPVEGAFVLEGGPPADPLGQVALDCRSADGTGVPIGFRGMALSDPDADPLGVLFVGQDLRMARALRRETEQRTRAERGMAIERALVEAALDSISDGVLAVDAAGVVRLVNASLATMLGQADEDLLGRIVSEALVLRDEATGDPVPWSRSRLDTSARTSGLPPVYRLQVQDGRTRLVEMATAPLRLPAGQPGGHVIALRDVTERRRAEADLVRASKVESLGVLAAGIAHDFNNSLTAVVGYLSLARASTAEPDALEGFLSRAQDNLDQAQTLMRQLLSFGRGASSERLAVDLASVLEESVRLLDLGGRWTVELRVAPDLQPAHGHRAQLRQVFDNLLLNARQAMPEGGPVVVEAENVVLDEVAAARHANLSPGPYVRVRVADRGPGIPADALPRIFDPFFSTKSDGTGLGLSTVFAVVSGHRGAVDVQSEPGAGARFEVLLPAHGA